MGPWTTYAVPWIIYREPWTSNIGYPGPLIGYPGQNGIGVPGKGVPKYNLSRDPKTQICNLIFFTKIMSLIVLTKLNFCQQIPYIGLKISMLSLILCKDFVEGPLLFSKLQATHFAQKKLTSETTYFF